MGRLLTGICLSVMAIAVMTGCGSIKQPLQLKLPAGCDSPDGMTIGKDGYIYLSMNNAGKGFKFANPGKIMRISPEDKIEEVMVLPKHPDTGKASPLGIVQDKDGNLFVSDNQEFAGGKLKSRVLKITMKNGKGVKCQTVVEGLQVANGIDIYGDYLYVNNTNMNASVYPMLSGVYRFKLSDLKGGKPIKVGGALDPHFFMPVTTYWKDPLMKVGANGICFDSKGNMYVCNFGEQSVLKAVLDEKGNVKSVKVLCKGQGLESTDGIHVDQDDNLWVADFMGNAIGMIDSVSGKVTIIAKNMPGDGKWGDLDAPSECIRRGDKVYCSNIDITYGPNKADDLHTMSIIFLKD